MSYDEYRGWNIKTISLCIDHIWVTIDCNLLIKSKTLSHEEVKKIIRPVSI